MGRWSWRTVFGQTAALTASAGCSITPRRAMVEAAPVRVLSNVASFEAVGGHAIENHCLPTSASRVNTLLWLVREAVRAYRYDAIFLNCDVTQTLLLSLLLTILPFNRCKLISADLVLRVPKTRGQAIRTFIKRLLLKRVDLFILFHKEFSAYTKWFGINPERVVYVPFKVNSLDLIRQQPTREGEYIFTGGVSLRDWETLAAAMRGLEIPLWIVTKDAEAHRLRQLFPSHVRWVQDDGSTESWIQLMAGAKFVVLPIAPESAAASGISTYLSAMALRKCVIISDGPATRGILLDGQHALVVPPRDPEALRAAIRRVDQDEQLRRRLAEAGYAYAMSCGDTTRLYRDFIECICRAVRGPAVHARLR